MEFSMFVPLMVAAIQSAGQVLASFTSKAKQAASNYIFDKTFVENTIIDSAEQLAELLNVASSDLKQEMREQSIIDVVQELQAHVASLGDLLSFVKTSEITPAMAERLITGGLLPLQVSLKKAELRLGQYGRDDMRLYCHVVGTNTLIAGYVYAGQDVPTLQKDLKDSIYIFQKRLLDTIAQTTVQANRDFPWDKVPYLLTADGVSDLFKLYNSTLQNTEKGPPAKSKLTPSKEPELKPNTPSIVISNRNWEVIRTARKLHGIFNILSCSECGFGNLEDDDLICPSCNRKFM